MATNRNGGASHRMSTSDFNARAAALSQRLGPVAAPPKTQKAARARWQEKSQPAPAEPEPEAEASSETPASDEDEA